MREAILIILASTPSIYTDKKIICKRLHAALTNISVFPVTTTKKIKKDWADQSDKLGYDLVTARKFNSLMKNNDLAFIYEKDSILYGMNKTELDKRLANNEDLIYRADIKTALEIKKLYNNCAIVSIIPESIEQVKQLITKKLTELNYQKLFDASPNKRKIKKLIVTEEEKHIILKDVYDKLDDIIKSEQFKQEINSLVNATIQDLQLCLQTDYVLVHTSQSDVVRHLKSIVRAERLRTVYNKEVINHLT